MLVMFLWNEAELKKVLKSLKDRSFPSKVADIWNRSPSSAMSAEMVSGELRGRLGDWTEVDDGSFNVGPFLFQTNCWFWTVLSVIRRASNFDIVVFSIKSSGVALCRCILLCNSKIVLLRLLCSTLSSLLGIGGTIGHEAGQQVIQLQGSLVSSLLVAAFNRFGFQAPGNKRRYTDILQIT